MTPALIAAALEVFAGLLRRGASDRDARAELQRLLDGWPDELAGDDADAAVAAALDRTKPVP